MKKLFIATLLVAALGTSAFADVNKVSYKVLDHFKTEFKDAENVLWSSTNDYTTATFTLDDEKMQAFYTTDGDLIGFSKTIDIKVLPAKAMKKINKEYPGFSITDAIRFENDEDCSYYVSLQNGNARQVLKVSTFGDVKVFKPLTK